MKKHLAILAVAALGIGCRDSRASSSSSSGSGPNRTDGKTVLTLVYGSEKRAWIDREIEELARAHPEFVVDAKPMGSGEAVQAIRSGSLKANVFSPASSAYLELLDGDARRDAPKSEPLVLSPLVVATWRPMAEALGWPDRSLSWSDFLGIATDPKGWGGKGHPEWGRFKLAHTHPETSNSGFLAVLAEAYAGAGKTRDLGTWDLEAERTRAFLSEVEGTVVYYGRSTGFFMDKMIARGPGFLSAAVVYENLVVESYARSPRVPIVAVYPKEGTFWADHPYRVLDGTPAERRAADVLFAHLRSRPAQERALALGFRPADPKIPIGAPIDSAHGVDPRQPQTILPLPPKGVLERLPRVWQATKKGADVVIVFDKSGSMKGKPLDEAQAGAKAFVGSLGERDEVTFAPFDHAVHPERGPVRLGDTGARTRIATEIDMTAADGGTALYDAIALAHERALVRAAKTPGSIHAVVVMTDGRDEGSRTTLPALRERLRRAASSDASGEAPVKLFTIAYGSAAETKVLDEIAEAAGGWSGRGSVDTIREVYVEVASFF